MDTRSVRGLWITRKSDDGPAELLEAWDEYSIEENYEGWKAAVGRALDAVGSDVRAWRFIDFTMPADLIEKAFDAPIIPVGVHDPRDGADSS